MRAYNHKYIERKWQKEWDNKKPYHAQNLNQNKSKKPKFYSLVEFPYPSGDGLHVGHPRPYIGMDVISRKKRMEGFNVLYPIGWDAFGLPTENYAIKTGKSPEFVTKKNSDNFRRQIKSLGISFDWDREINTTDPKYYKWTQWLFLKFLEKDLAYKKKMSINWCPKDKIGLANEEVINGCCERCGTKVEKREKEQWMLAITKYAERLDKDLDGVDYLPQIKAQQRNWIGKSEGVEIEFEVKSEKLNVAEKIKVFTTRPDTLFGVTYVVLAPEHQVLDSLKGEITNWNEVRKYIDEVRNKTEIDRTDIKKEKTGVELKGVKAINPANKEEIPVFVADYCLADYGTGAVMAVPAHDERDFDFAKKYNLEIRNVINPYPISPVVVSVNKKEDMTELINKKTKEILLGEEIWLGDGILRNSKEFDGLAFSEAKKKITEFVEGKWKTTFKLRDWVFSRQRYWGEPIPVIHCEKCGVVPVPEKDLPVVLPKVKNYQPTDTGESPLANISKWVNVKCPKCKSPAKRETDTMPNWAGSSWYYLRYTDPKNNKVFADSKALDYWTPVDWYNGGMEHTTLHLLYSRFWHKFLFDLNLVPTKEPYKKRTSHGLILAKGGEKMSKSRGNVINPDEIVQVYGADTLRVYEMFMGPFDQAIEWDSNSIIGCRRFLEKVWRLMEKVDSKNKSENSQIIYLIQKTIKKVGEDIEEMRFNTAISSLMVLVNQMTAQEKINKCDFESLLLLLYPFAPHITDELWLMLGHKKSTQMEFWPKFDLGKIKEDVIKIGVQINGKVRGFINIEENSTENEIIKKIKEDQSISKWLTSDIKKTIYIKNKIFSIVLG